MHNRLCLFFRFILKFCSPSARGKEMESDFNPDQLVKVLSSIEHIDDFNGSSLVLPKDWSEDKLKKHFDEFVFDSNLCRRLDGLTIEM
jgi:hypothetical protein